MSLSNSVIFADIAKQMPQHVAKELDEHIKVCQAYRTDIENEVEDDSNSLVNKLMKPCYRFSKLAKQNFFDDPYFSFMFLAFAFRGRAFIEKKAAEGANGKLLMEIVDGLSDYAVDCLRMKADSDLTYRALLKHAMAMRKNPPKMC